MFRTVAALGLVAALSTAAEAAPKGYFDPDLAQAAADLPKTLRDDKPVQAALTGGDPAAALVADGRARL
ncbi:MAG: hypothetical protein KGI57_10955, partial [Hyphomicrobiales bacterium]|nr:hypothetical protein [Hyphomicrobiales bacterium]